MEIKIYYTGDVHWNVTSFSHISSFLKKQEQPYLLLDAGDSIAMLHNGLDSILSMNLLKYDAMTLGNHELDIPPDNLPQSLSKAEFDILMPNVSIKGFNRGKISTIREISGARVGILGVCFHGIMRGQTSFPEYGFTGSVEDVLLGNVSKLKSECDVLILLSHLGFQHDCEVAREFPDIDIIIGGHSHTVIRKDYRVGKTLICHSGGEGNFLGEVSISLKDKKITDSGHRLVELAKERPDPGFASMFEKAMSNQGLTQDKQVIGEAVTDFIAEKYSGETALGDFFADLIRFSLEADIVILNASCVNPILTKGAITFEKIEKVIYWDNELYVGSLPGEEIYRIFSKMLSFFLEDPYFFCYFSGINIEYVDDPMCRKVFQNLEKLEKIAPQSVRVQGGKCLEEVSICDLCRKQGSPVCLRKDMQGCSTEKIRIYVDGNPMVRDSFYSIATTGYLINGGLDQKYSSFLEKYPFIRVEKSLKDLMLEYFKENEFLRYVTDGRLEVRRLEDELS